MYLLDQDILCIDSGVIVAVIDCRASIQLSTTNRIWQKYPIAYEKYTKHLTFLNWHPGKIQLVKASDGLWVCNLAGKRRHKLDFEILREAFTKLRNLSLEYGLKLYIPFESDLDEIEWSHYVQSLKSFCPEIALCFSDSSIDDFLSVTKQPNFQSDELTKIIFQRISSLKIFKVRLPGNSGGAFAIDRYGFGVGSGGYAGESNYTELISLNDLTRAINDPFRIVEFLQITNKLSDENNDLLAQYKNSLLARLQSIPTQHRLRKSDGSEHKGIALQDVFDTLQDLHDYEQKSECS